MSVSVRRLSVLAVSTLAIAVLSGCGDTSDKAQPSPTPTTAAATDADGKSKLGSSPQGNTGPSAQSSATNKSAPGKGVKPYVDNWSRHTIEDGPNAGRETDLTIKASGTASDVVYLTPSCGPAAQLKRCGFVNNYTVHIVDGQQTKPFNSLPAGSATPKRLWLEWKNSTYFVAESGNRKTITFDQYKELVGDPALTQTPSEETANLVNFSVERVRTGLLGLIAADQQEGTGYTTYVCSEGVAEADRPKCFKNG
jgi:hypothetical protein